MGTVWRNYIWMMLVLPWVANTGFDAKIVQDIESESGGGGGGDAAAAVDIRMSLPGYTQSAIIPYHLIGRAAEREHLTCVQSIPETSAQDGYLWSKAEGRPLYPDPTKREDLYAGMDSTLSLSMFVIRQTNYTW